MRGFDPTCTGTPLLSLSSFLYIIFTTSSPLPPPLSSPSPPIINRHLPDYIHLESTILLRWPRGPVPLRLPPGANDHANGHALEQMAFYKKRAEKFTRYRDHDLAAAAVSKWPFFVVTKFIADNDSRKGELTDGASFAELWVAARAKAAAENGDDEPPAEEEVHRTSPSPHPEEGAVTLSWHSLGGFALWQDVCIRLRNYADITLTHDAERPWNLPLRPSVAIFPVTSIWQSGVIRHVYCMKDHAYDQAIAFEAATPAQGECDDIFAARRAAREANKLAKSATKADKAKEDEDTTPKPEQ
ncbi:hypothetical protein NM208_g2072 [Fusarium decemcellulare]|uniref:Uncharacterized protein n=1 Tax=Fusarium decemcellulare TaxID=57161 RepID=A0ACC1STX8_9HYPO|nr:hypothetical protein NM208_g2072 [Fusarium decemcellulare]